MALDQEERRCQLQQIVAERLDPERRFAAQRSSQADRLKELLRPQFQELTEDTFVAERVQKRFKMLGLPLSVAEIKDGMIEEREAALDDVCRRFDRRPAAWADSRGFKTYRADTAFEEYTTRELALKTLGEVSRTDSDHLLRQALSVYDGSEEKQAKEILKKSGISFKRGQAFSTLSHHMGKNEWAYFLSSKPGTASAAPGSMLIHTLRNQAEAIPFAVDTGQARP